jgi:hypothetical protein
VQADDKVMDVGHADIVASPPPPNIRVQPDSWAPGQPMPRAVPARASGVGYMRSAAREDEGLRARRRNIDRRRVRLAIEFRQVC